MTRNTVYVDGEPLIDVYHDLSKYSQHCLLRLDGEEGPSFNDPDTYIDVDVFTDVEDTGKTVAVIFEKEAIFSEDDVAVEMNVSGEQYELDFDRKLNVHIYGTEV
jgi:hypothetical protein